MKTQLVRLADVLLIGPFLIYAAHQSRPLTDDERRLMTALGWATIAYNLVNLLRAGRR